MSRLLQCRFVSDGMLNACMLLLSAQCLALVLIGCGSSVTTQDPRPSDAIFIVNQPTAQTVPIGRSATFTVTATGTAPILYQWSKGGVSIPGANSASYTTPEVTIADGKTEFEVTVTNSISSATSSTAELSIAARAPALGDLRYLLMQQVTTPFNNGGSAVQLGIQQYQFANALGSPLVIGLSALSCEWSSSVLFLPAGMTGLNMNYGEAFTQYQPYMSYLQSISTGDAVITSFDIEPACYAAGVSWVQTTSGQIFDMKIESINPSELQTTVAADGAQSRIVTAVSFDDQSGELVLISYGWSRDTTTGYDSVSVVVAPGNVLTEITTLANSGFFISAFGGNDKDGYVIVGMRVHGDVLPRIVSNGSNTNQLQIPATVIAWYSEADGTHTVYQQ